MSFEERMKDIRIIKNFDTALDSINEEFQPNKQLVMNLLDIDKFVKINELEEVSNPVFFIRDGIPTTDGLLSNEIFGITKYERANTFAYIDLGDTFMHPFCYKIWSRLDSKISECVHGIKKFSLDEHGNLVEDDKGKSGVKFIKDNVDKINIKSTDSTKRDLKIKFLRDMKPYMFITKWPVIPAFYRDVNTDGGRVGVGEINEFYRNLLIAVKALRESFDYGLSLSDATRGRIQDVMVDIYNWFGAEPNISKKFGIIKRSNMSKTSDYASRLVISAPDLKCERVEDLLVDTDHCALPLASSIVNFYPFVMFHVKTFFENEFAGKIMYPHITKDGKVVSDELGDWQTAFSPAVIKKNLDRFIHGYSNRFITIDIPFKDPKIKAKMHLIGYNMTPEEYAIHPVIADDMTPTLNRSLTWCDVFYMAAVAATRDRCVLITRYPIDSYFNQYPSLVRVSSTAQTEQVVINNTMYTHYPHITEDMVGKNTSNMFIDTLSPCNAMIKAMGGDYDGDQVTVKGVFSDEANAELQKQINSKSQFISLGGRNIREVSKEGAQAIYNLTLVLPGTELSKSIEF